MKTLKNRTLKDCAQFFGINGTYDYHKGIVNATVLAIIIFKIAECDFNYLSNNIKNEEIQNYQVSNKSIVYIFLNGKKYHLYCSCSKMPTLRKKKTKRVEDNQKKRWVKWVKMGKVGRGH